MTEHETIFAQWMRALGLHAKQVAKAGRLLGYSFTATGRRNASDEFLTANDRIAMSAIRAGLPPWSPEDDARIARIGRLNELLESDGRLGKDARLLLENIDRYEKTAARVRELLDKSEGA